MDVVLTNEPQRLEQYLQQWRATRIDVSQSARSIPHCQASYSGLRWQHFRSQQLLPNTDTTCTHGISSPRPVASIVDRRDPQSRRAWSRRKTKTMARAICYGKIFFMHFLDYFFGF
jgi:hypothetical protein